MWEEKRRINMNDFLGIKEDLISIGLKPKNELLSYSDVKLKKYFTVKQIDLFSAIFIHLKIHLNKYYNSKKFDQDPYYKYLEEKKFNEIKYHYLASADNVSQISEFIEALFTLDLVRLPISIIQIKNYVSYYNRNYELSKNERFKNLYHEYDQLLSLLTQTETEFLQEKISIPPLRFQWYQETGGLIIKEFYTLKINERKINCSGDAVILVSHYERVIADLETLDNDITALINFQLFFENDDNCDPVINYEKAENLKIEIFKLIHLQSLPYAISNQEEKKLKKYFYKKITDLNPVSPYYVQSVEDLWIEFLVKSKLETIHLSLDDSIVHLKNINRILQTKLFKKIKQVNEVKEHIAILKFEILNIDLIRAEVHEMNKKNQRRSLAAKTVKVHSINNS